MIRMGLLVVCLAHLANAQEVSTSEAVARCLPGAHAIQFASESHLPQPDSSLDYLGRWGWGQCAGVAAMGNYVLTGSGPTLLWLDMSDKHNPVIVWETLTNGPLSNFIIRDSIGYALLSSRSLLIVDLRSPSTPVIRVELPINSGLLSLAVEGSLAFAKKYTGFLYCIDVSNPFSPYIRSVIRETSAQWGKLAISNHNLYIGDQNGFTEYVDVSNPDSARVTVLYNVAPLVMAANARDTLLFLGVYGSRLFIYSIMMPASPVQLSNVSINSTQGIASITMRGDTAFVGTIESNIVAVNFSDRRNPVVLGTYTPPVARPGLSVGFLAAQDTILYCSFWNGLTTFSVANPAAMSVLCIFPTGYECNKLVVKHGLAFVTSGYAGLWVVDISDPAHPRRISNIQTEGYAYDLVIDSTIAYMSLNDPRYLLSQDAPNRVLSLDISRPDSLRVLDSYTLDSPFAMSLSGSLLFVTQTNNIAPPPDTTLTVLDVSDPSNMRLTSRTVVGNVREIACRDSIAFVACQSGSGSPHPGMNIFDFRNPVVPQLLSTTLTSAQGVSINGNLAFVHRGDSTFAVDITALTTPTILGRVRHPPPSYGGPWESIAKEIVLWTNGGELGVIDVSNPNEPRGLFEIEIFGQGGIDLVGDTVYVTRADGVWIYRYNRGPTFVENETDPSSSPVHLFANYPNPFNAATQLKFVNAAREETRIDVYNLLGQHIRCVFNGVADAGEHTIEIHASDLPSGIYFCRLQSRNAVNVSRIMLIK